MKYWQGGKVFCLKWQEIFSAINRRNIPIYFNIGQICPRYIPIKLAAASGLMNIIFAEIFSLLLTRSGLARYQAGPVRRPMARWRRAELEARRRPRPPSRGRPAWRRKVRAVMRRGERGGWR